jgi:hypothetical protein
MVIGVGATRGKASVPSAPGGVGGSDGTWARHRHWWQPDIATLSDGEVVEVTWRDRFVTHRWVRPLWLWWGYGVRGYPKPPPFDQDPVARHFGFVEGVPACKGPICEEHEWRVVDRG